MSALETILGLLYIRNITKSFREPLGVVPNYIEETIPFFLVTIALETCFLLLKKTDRTFCINDTLCSLSQGLQSQLISVLMKGFEFQAYVYVWTNLKIFNIAWNSTYGWIFTLLAVDLGYYWFHRIAHECNLVWASHQVHHSSEFYNLGTALRQSVVQNYFSWIFYLPLAFCGVAPSMFLAHAQFNTIYQFWIHSALVDKLGPLELVMNTPSHHRVHHGSNVKYLDKNYGGVLIVWDRLFGTFCPEEETPTYGLVHNLETYDLWKVQLGHFHGVISDFWEQEGWANKLKRVFYGPGWCPGSERLGDPNQVPEPDKTRDKFDSGISIWLQLYIVIHFGLTSITAFVLTKAYFFTATTTTLLAIMVTLNLTTMGWLMDNSSLGPPAEFLRCIIITTVFYQWQFSQISWISTAKTIITLIMMLSAVFWPVLNRTWVQICVKKFKSQ